MPFVHQEQISSTVRSKYETALKEQLRQALLAPGLTSDQRKAIKEQLNNLGQPKVYRAGSPPKPGAISFD